MRWLALLMLCVALAGCGFGEGESTGEVTLTVTRDFGAERLHEGIDEETASEGDTVMRVLQGAYDVKTRYGGGFVQEIDGVAGGRRSGRPVDWFYYVNGIEASEGAASRKLEPGDRVWWDHHDWGAAMRIPAVVGSYPEPFLSGPQGKKLPIRVECATSARDQCREVRERLSDAGAKVGGIGTRGTRAGPEVLRVLVGTWNEVRVDPAARRIEAGPKVSGVFARPAGSGRSIELLDPRGRPVRTLGQSAGLVAATRFVDQAPTWVVTGTDDVGVAAAAGALVEARLKDHFAVALENGREVPLPLPTSAEIEDTVIGTNP
jgi:Domain of unknown function (DUF4430)